ncbi:MAG: precorrin-6y C5,15-methyltransferase (decarboxylating) subunit CbiE, partial [Nitratireductor sp.]
MTSSRAFCSQAESSQRWLTIVGIGEDGMAGLGEEARRAIANAEIVFGGARHLELAAGQISGETRQWPSPFGKALDEIEALRGKKVCVLASGDPFHFGVGATLTRRIPADEMRVFSAPSSFAL